MTALRLVERPSPNQAARAAPVEVLVLHYTGMIDGPAAVARLCDPRAGVSAHYVVERDGTVLRLVAEDRVAWHAGVSAWRGRMGLNATSIGIEIVNGGHDFHLPPFPARQIDAVCRLSSDILGRWPIAAVDVVGHADTAPMRKRDPGERFPWAELAAAGIGIWPAPTAGDAAISVTRALGEIGYVLDDAPQPTSVSAALGAFQRRFLPTLASPGRADAATRARLHEIATAYRLASPPVRSQMRCGAGDQMAAPAYAPGRKVRAPRKHGAG